jgi:hypothetical protein
MSIAEYLQETGLTLRVLGEMCNVHYSTIYRLSLPSKHKSSRNKISLDIAQKIVSGTDGHVTLQDLLEKK